MKSLKTVLLYLVFAIAFFVYFVPYSVSAQSVPSFVEVDKTYHFRIGVENNYYGRVIEIHEDGWIKLEQIARPLGGEVYREPIIWINTNNTFVIAPPDKNDPRWLK